MKKNNITVLSSLLNSGESYQEKKSKEFANILKEIIEKHIIPKFGSKLTMSIEQGLFTSGEYGSYRIPFIDESKKEVCYIIADTIIGEWKVYEKK
jgi:hypothetical protein